MKTLPIVVRMDGFPFTQVFRGKRVAIYIFDASPGESFYVVFLIEIKAEYVLNGKHYPTQECFPPPEAVGKSTWCYEDFQTALNAFKALEWTTCIRE